MPKVLIVDDEPDNIELMTRRLARRGFDCIGATTAAEGVSFAKSELPVMDGLEATRRLKAEAKTKSIPVIALTAHAMAEDRERAMAAGADEYESKPVDLAQLLAKIETLTRAKP
jgi:two-component system, cell cycle response regulator DivK